MLPIAAGQPSSRAASGTGLSRQRWTGAATAARMRPALLRRATQEEIVSLLAEAREIVPIGATDGVWPMVAKNPDVIRAICLPPDITPVGIFAYLPLNAFGASMIVSGQLDGAAPDPAWICRRR